MVADVPIGAFLSGGIDSSLVTSYMADHSSQVRTFSIDFPSAHFSEGRYARQISEIYGTEHEEFLVEPDMVPRDRRGRPSRRRAARRLPRRSPRTCSPS